MRERLDADRVRRFLAAIGRYADTDGACYLTGGATADALVEADLVDRARLRAAFEEIEPRLYRYPGIDPQSFRRAVERAAGS